MKGRLFSFALVAAFAFAAPAWAQVSSPASSATAGSSCTGAPANGSSSFFLWPDTSGHILQCNGTTWVTATEPAGAPGSTGYVQYNNGGALAGSANLFWNNSSDYLSIGTTNDMVLDYVGSVRPLVVQSASTATTVGSGTNSIAIVNSDTTANNTSSLIFADITGASTNQYADAEIVAVHGARTNTDYNSGQLAFMTAPGGNIAPAERVRIDNNGNVGIGTTGPNLTGFSGTTLTVLANAVSGGNIELANAAADASGSLAGSVDFNFVQNTLANDSRIAEIRSVTDGSTANNRGGDLQFWVRGSAGNLTDQMILLNNGNVGIGTTIPATALAVVGNSGGTVTINSPSMDAPTYGASGTGALAIRQGAVATGSDALLFGINSSAGNSWI